MNDEETITEVAATPLPDGEYAIVELFGHTTLIGRIAEVERFGTKMLAMEPLFNGEFLPAIFHGGAAIYRLTPCSAELAFKEQPRKEWQLPAAVRIIVPLALLPPPASDAPQDDEHTNEPEDDERPF